MKKKNKIKSLKVCSVDDSLNISGNFPKLEHTSQNPELAILNYQQEEQSFETDIVDEMTIVINGLKERGYKNEEILQLVNQVIDKN